MGAFEYRAKNRLPPYFHIEWIMDNVFKLTPEEKAENAKYWAMDVANQAAGATGEPGAPSEGGGGGGPDVFVNVRVRLKTGRAVAAVVADLISLRRR